MFPTFFRLMLLALIALAMSACGDKPTPELAGHDLTNFAPAEPTDQLCPVHRTPLYRHETGGSAMCYASSPFGDLDAEKIRLRFPFALIDGNKLVELHAARQPDSDCDDDENQ